MSRVSRPIGGPYARMRRASMWAVAPRSQAAGQARTYAVDYCAGRSARIGRQMPESGGWRDIGVGRDRRHEGAEWILASWSTRKTGRRRRGGSKPGGTAQVLDRAVIQVTAPRDGVTRREIPAPPTLEERWTNVEYAVESANERLRTTYFGGDAFPMYFPNLGPDVFAGYLGCDIVFGEDTSWSVPLIEDWDRAPRLWLDPENKWWKLTLEMTRAAVEVGAGRFIVGLTDLHGGLDAVAALRDPQNLALDLIEHPEAVKRAVDDLIPVWFEVYEGLRREINPRIPGTTTWLTAWSAVRYYPVSCDFICMISREMFDEFVLKDLRAETDWLDRSIFHLDGPAAVRHLDSLLEMPKDPRHPVGARREDPARADDEVDPAPQEDPGRGKGPPPLGQGRGGRAAPRGAPARRAHSPDLDPNRRGGPAGSFAGSKS